MFVTQPPCKTVTVLMHSWPLSDIEHHADLKRAAGIKMGELFDSINEEMRYHPHCSGSVVEVSKFDTEDCAQSYATTKCKIRNGAVCRPVQLP